MPSLILIFLFFLAGIVHTFEAVVWKGDRKITTFVEIEAKDEYVIPVKMYGPAVPQQASEVNEIIASFEYDGSDFTYQWFCNDSTTSNLKHVFFQTVDYFLFF